jgi:hypothetical protein
MKIVSSLPFCWGFTFEDLQKEQSKDKDLHFIIDRLKDKKVPDEGILFLSSPESKFYWLNKELFQLVDGVLFKNNSDADDLQLVIPDSLKEQALLWHDDIPSAGHQGVARSKAKLKEKLFWVRLSRDVEPMCHFLLFAIKIRRKSDTVRCHLLNIKRGHLRNVCI